MADKTMTKATAITRVFLDIGGVLLTDGWDHHARRRAATNFMLKLAELEDRHHLTFDTYACRQTLLLTRVAAKPKGRPGPCCG